jgi:hypothetical protein
MRVSSVALRQQPGWLFDFETVLHRPDDFSKRRFTNDAIKFRIGSFKTICPLSDIYPKENDDVKKNLFIRTISDDRCVNDGDITGSK